MSAQSTQTKFDIRSKDLTPKLMLTRHPIGLYPQNPFSSIHKERENSNKEKDKIGHLEGRGRQEA